MELSVTLSNIKPDDLLGGRQKLKDILSSGVINYIEVMAQHVNPRILERMSRGSYDPVEFAGFINEYSKNNIHFDTCIMIGFPGETLAEFDELISFLRLIRTPNFTMYAMPFSDRPGTKASDMDGKIDEKEMKRRLDMINTEYAVSLR